MTLAEATLAKATLPELTLAETTLAEVRLDLAEAAGAASGRDQGGFSPRQARSAPARFAAADTAFEAALQLDLTARTVVC